MGETEFLTVIISFPLKISFPIDVFPFRLDFNMFDLTDVATTGVCTDSFEVTGPTGRNPSVICGVNTGQHSKSSKSIITF